MDLEPKPTHSTMSNVIQVIEELYCEFRTVGSLQHSIANQILFHNISRLNFKFFNI